VDDTRSVAPESRPDQVIRAVVGEDHSPLRRRVILAVEEDPRIVVVAEAGDSTRLAAVCRDERPDCVLVGTTIEPLGGPDTVALVHAEAPRASVVVVGSYTDDSETVTALRAGATGFVNRDALAQAPAVVRAVTSGVVALPPLVARLVVDELTGGTAGPRPEPAPAPAERGSTGAGPAADGLQVLEHLAAGRTYGAAADALGIDPATAKHLAAATVARLRAP
jgi:DNA-binding NarL/FixJ family response regulator